uniref:trypsin-like peptidase domain-containing protein n=1 Tax=Acetatifactor sp. TaxID=1872090 RepID=UPI004055CCD3
MQKLWKKIRLSLLCVTAMTFLAACGDNEDAVVSEAESVQENMEASQNAETENNGDGTDENTISNATPNHEIAQVEYGLVGLSAQNGTDMILGSGFITEITDEEIYICTCKHVIEDVDTWTVTFADGTQVEAEKVGCSQMFDVGVVKLDSSKVAKETLENLHTVSVNLEEWMEVRDSGTNIQVKVYRIKEEGSTGECVEGTIESIMAPFESGNGLNHTKMDITLANGDSGAAVLDENGNLYTMVMSTYHKGEGKPSRWGVPLTSLITSYKEITSREWISLF